MEVQKEELVADELGAVQQVAAGWAGLRGATVESATAERQAVAA